MNIYLIRHGEDPDGYRGGWSSLALTEEGIKQCELLAQYLDANKDDFNIDRIIASDLNRTKQTADIINEKLKLPIEYTTDLRETNNGKLAGMKNEIAEQEYPGLYFSSLKIDERYPKGESPIEFFTRIKEYFEKLIANLNKEDNIMLVTHKGVINIIYCLVNNIEWNNKMKSCPCDNTSIYRLVIDTDRMYFDIENSTEHL